MKDLERSYFNFGCSHVELKILKLYFLDNNYQIGNIGYDLCDYAGINVKITGRFRTRLL